MADCLFCSIVAGEIPSNRVYEDDHVLAFHDIDPKAPVHVLVIPKQHIGSAADLTEERSELAGRLQVAAAKIARDLDLTDRGFRLVSNVGVQGGQSVAHLHYHVLGGRDFQWPPG